MSIATRLTTADELFRLPADGFRYELVEGELRKMTPAGSEHGLLSNEIGWRLTEHVRRHGLGQVFGAETGFRVSRNPDTVLAPDASFIRKERIQTIGIPKGYFPEAPALVVEIVSPNDTAEYVENKMRRWIAAGIELGWVVYPGGRSVTVYRSLTDIQVLARGDALNGESVVPGFQCSIADLFAQLDP